MKGILKGLRNISQMFEPNCKEPEMQIGFPTDVKHVAHIGWDGPSTTAPTWMNDFKSTPDFSTTSSNNSGEGKEQHSSPTKPSSSQGGLQESRSRDLPELPKPSKRNQDSSNPSSRQGRRHKKSSSGAESPTKESCGAQKESRRKKMRDSSHGGSTRSSSRSKAQDASCSDQDMKSEDQFPELF